MISRVSAAILALAGVGLLFAPDVILPRLIPGFPAHGLWLGQLLAAAWMAVGALNWLNQGALLGGIYSRPLVLTNAALYFISATVIIRSIANREMPATVGLAAIPAVFLAGIYGWLLFRGPTERDFQHFRRTQHGPTS